MRIKGALVLAASFGATVALAGAPTFAKGKKRSSSEAPSASAQEVNKLKAVRLGDPKAGTFKWGMKEEDVVALVKDAINAKYQPRLEQAAQDPGKQQRIRDEMEREISAVQKSYTKFEGQKSGWDVSIIGPEFEQNTAESVLVTKEDIWTRYFFFFEDGLYKMFLAFNKDALAGKSFQDFGKSMEAKYGKAREVYRDEKTHGGVRHVLDHFEWAAGGGDRLKLVDRSEFYGVFCLVLYDGPTQDRVNERRKAVNPDQTQKDELVEAVTSHKSSGGHDTDDDIIDRVTGHEVKKPGEDESHPDIVVPSPGSKKGSAASAAKSASSGSSGASASGSGSEAESKDSSASKKKPAAKKGNGALDGLEL